MKRTKLFLLVVLFLASCTTPAPTTTSTPVTSADFMQTSDAYLGQTPPGAEDAPKLFLKGITERIAISPNGKVIYFTEGSSTKYYEYTDDEWKGPLLLFDNQVNPGLSGDGHTLYFEGGWYSTKSDTGWGVPAKLWNTSKTIHYLQVTNAGNYYATSDPIVSSKGDFSQFIGNGSDVVVKSLESPINSRDNGVDFFIARDESYIIFVKKLSPSNGDLYISYKKPDLSWSTPNDLGSIINSSAWEYGPYVSPDNKYLFFSRYPDNNTYWVNIENILKHAPK